MKSRTIIEIISGALIAFIFFISGTLMQGHKNVNVESTKTVIEKSSDLTDWEILELAIMKTESDLNTNARGTKGDLGLFQITEIYVEEINRLLGEPVYVHTDAFVPERALEMFNIYQEYHNPRKDYIRAINAHNPGGESIGYSQKVLSNMKWIENYEQYRKMVQNFIYEEKTNEITE